MLRGLALGASLVYGAYLTRNAIMVARIIVPAVAQWRRDMVVIAEMRRERAAIPRS